FMVRGAFVTGASSPRQSAIQNRVVVHRTVKSWVLPWPHAPDCVEESVGDRQPMCPRDAPLAWPGWVSVRSWTTALLMPSLHLVTFFMASGPKHAMCPSAAGSSWGVPPRLHVPFDGDAASRVRTGTGTGTARLRSESVRG